MAQGTPWIWQAGPVTAGYTLLSRRTTKRVFEDSGLEDVIEDEWDASTVAPPTEERWTGTTTFYVDTDVARRTNPASNDVCYALLEGGATVRAKEDPEYSFWANQLLSYRIPVPKAVSALPPGLLSIDHDLGHGVPPGHSMEEPSPPEVISRFADIPVVRDLWEALEEALEAYKLKGTRTRFNLVEKNAPRDPTGQFLRDTIPQIR